MPLQEYLDVRVSEQSQLQKLSEKLPLPMNTIFRKMYNFSKQYPLYGLDVSIKALSAEVEDADEAVE